MSSTEIESLVAALNARFAGGERLQGIGAGADDAPRFELYHFFMSMCSYKLRLVLDEIGAAYVSHDVDIFPPDIKNYYRERSDAPRLLVRKEMDLNRDGKTDVISLFDPDGMLEREELDADYDGRFDWIDHYQKGERVMSEYDTDSDGRPNVFKYYIKGSDGLVHLDRKERDEDGDGAIDVWEKFSQAGEVTRTARDTDGDGRMDVRED